MPGPQRILICDDQPMIHETLGVYLKNEGFEFCSAMDGQEATDLAESYKCRRKAAWMFVGRSGLPAAPPSSC